MKRKDHKSYRRDDDDGFRKVSFSRVKEDKARKKVRNFDNALRSKNLDVLISYDE